MHPPLHKPHPLCGELVAALQDCHADHPVAKFWGKCNSAKYEMDRCFKREKELMRQMNREKRGLGRLVETRTHAGDAEL